MHEVLGSLKLEEGRRGCVSHVFCTINPRKSLFCKSSGIPPAHVLSLCSRCVTLSVILRQLLLVFCYSPSTFKAACFVLRHFFFLAWVKNRHFIIDCLQENGQSVAKKLVYTCEGLGDQRLGVGLTDRHPPSLQK